MAVLIGPLFLAGLALAGWSLARVLSPGSGPGEALMRAVVAAWTLGILLTEALLGLGVFGPVPVGLLGGALVLLGGLVGGRSAMSALGDVLGWLRARRGLEAMALVAVGVLSVATTSLTVALSISAWDSLLYHLPLAAGWVVEGRVPQPVATDAWDYYQHFPRAGDHLWAWMMVGDRSIHALPVGLMVLASSVLIQLGVALRAAGAPPGRVGLLMGLVVLVPPLVLQFEVAGTDLQMLGLLLALAHLLVLDRQPDAAGWAVAAFGVALAIKATAVAWLPVVVLAVLLARRRPWGALALGGAVASLLVGPDLLYKGLVHGNPLYPVPLGPLPGDPVLAATFSGEVLRFRPVAPYESWIHAAMVVLPAERRLGPAALLLAGLALVGALRHARGPRWALAGLAVLTVLPFLTPGRSVYMAVWGGNVARLWLPAWGALALLAAPAVGGVRPWVLALFAGVAAVHTLGFLGPGWLDAGPVAWGVLALALGATAAIVMAPPRWARWGLVGALAGLPLGVPLLQQPRLNVAQEATVDRAEPTWRALEEAPPSTVAVVTAFVGAGHQDLRFLWLGDRLQHRLLPISPYADGRHPDTAFGPVAAPLDEAAWLERLKAAGVDRVLVRRPAWEGAEAAWIAARPGRFELVAQDPTARLYRVLEVP